MAEVQQQLDRKKDEFRQRMQRCQEKEVELAAKQEGLKEQVRKFDKFLKENDAKRVRANRKAMEEVKLRDQKDRDLQVLLTIIMTIVLAVGFLFMFLFLFFNFGLYGCWTTIRSITRRTRNVNRRTAVIISINNTN